MTSSPSFRWFASSFVAVALLAPGAAALADPPREEVERLLAGYEAAPRPDDLRRLGDGVDRVLIAIASDPSASRLRRGRALFALGFVPSTAGRDFLRFTLRERRAAATPADVLDAAACARALGRFGADALPDLLPLLTHPSAEVRRAAALGLGDTGTDAARVALEQRIVVERAPTALDGVQAGLRALAAARR